MTVQGTVTLSQAVSTYPVLLSCAGVAVMLLEGESVQEEMGTGAAAQAAEVKYTVKTARRKCRDVMACNCSLVNAKPGCLKSAIVILERYAATM